jgi:hypothetical protein
MAELKTQKNNASVKDFIESVSSKAKKDDSYQLLKIFEDTTNYPATMWGDSIIGFGEYYYESDRSTQKGHWPLTGFSPRKQNISIYIMPGFSQYQDLLSNLGKHKTSKGSCLYINKLADIDIEILKEIISLSVEEMKKRYDIND